MQRVATSSRRWWILTGASTGLFLLMLDSTVVALALPPIRRELGASVAGVQWVQNVYLLVLAALVMTLGRLGQMLGRKRVFLAGMLGFAGGSAIAATAASTAQLVAGRAVQGAGAAALLALSPAIATVAIPEEERSRALGIGVAVSSVALAIGPLVGGAVIQMASWRWVFWLNIPLVAAALLVIAAATPESRDESAGRRLDVAGLITITFGLTLIVLALVEGSSWGWDSAATLGSLAGGLVLLAAFLVVERRVAEPMVDFRLLRSRPYLGASAAAFALVGSFWVALFLLPQYFEFVLGNSTLRSGLLVLPVTAPVVVIAPFAGRLVARVGARPLMTLGMACATAGMVIVTFVDADTGYRALLPGMFLFGIGLGLVYAALSAVAMAAPLMIPPLGGALLLAAGGALFQHVAIERRAGGAGFEPAFADALAATAWLLAAVLAAGALLTWPSPASAENERGPAGWRGRAPP
jgi:EmrB/QacA subfamily drug resistance transporter